MRYQLLAIDLDDTLLNENQKISARNKAAIRKAVQRGVRIVIATGRMFRTSLPYVRELELNDDWPMINYHGALIKTTESKAVIFHQPLANDLAVSIIGDAEARGCHVNAFIDDNIYVREENEFTDYYRSIAAVELVAVGELAPFLKEKGADPTKLTIISWEGRLEQVESLILEKYGSRVSALQSLPYFLEITDRRATKGQALQKLAEREGISREEIIAFGDSYNDLDMIRFAGLGVAVENARPEVRRAADLITSSNIEDGVARVIEEYVLG